MALGVVSNVVGVLPAFLLGGLASLVGDTMSLDSARLGLVTAAFFGCSAASSLLGGPLCERVGSVRSMRIGATLSMVAMLGVGTLVKDWRTLLAALCLAGIANGLANPATNLAYASALDTARLGTAFGAKQAAVPMASVVAGFAVPSLGLLLGWQPTFALTALGGICVWALSTRQPHLYRSARAARRDTTGMAALVVLTLGGAVTAAAANATAVFLVSSLTRSGLRLDRAGLLLALGSALAVVARLASGLLADTILRHHVLAAVVIMMLLGAVGWLLLSSATRDMRMWIGTAATFTFGWGWTGLYTLTAVRHHPNTAGSATGITQAGIFTGGMSGPLLFGALTEQHSFDVAWTAAALLAMLGAVLVMSSHLMHRRSTPHH